MLFSNVVQLVGGGQLAVDQQVAGLDERRVLGQLVDRVAAVAQDAGVTVDVGDRRRARRGVGETRVEGDEIGGRQQLADVRAGRPLGRLVHRQLQRVLARCGE